MRGKFAGALAFAFSIGVSQVAFAADMPVKAMAPAIAAPALTPSGYIELYGGGDRYNFFGEGDNAWTLGGAGRANWWLTPNVSMQLDAQGEGSQIHISGCSGPGCDVSVHDYLIAAHAMWRNPNYGIGVVGAVGDASPGFRFGAFGGEALVNWNMFTAYLQGGYGSTIGSNGAIDADASTWFVRGTGRYYPTQNWLLEGTVLGARSSVSPFFGGTSFDVDTLMWRVKAETMFNPWMSVYLAYQGSRSNFPAGFGCCGPGANDSVTDERLTVGIRAWLNRDNLRNNDITGAPLDFINPFSFFGLGGGSM